MENNSTDKHGRKHQRFWGSQKVGFVCSKVLSEYKDYARYKYTMLVGVLIMQRLIGRNISVCGLASGSAAVLSSFIIFVLGDPCTWSWRGEDASCKAP